MLDQSLEGSKILVVDDDPNVVELVKLYLERDGQDVLIARDGATGLELALEEQPDLVVLDLHAPPDGRHGCLPGHP